MAKMKEGKLPKLVAEKKLRYSCSINVRIKRNERDRVNLFCVGKIVQEPDPFSMANSIGCHQINGERAKQASFFFLLRCKFRKNTTTRLCCLLVVQFMHLKYNYFVRLHFEFDSQFRKCTHFFLSMRDMLLLTLIWFRLIVSYLKEIYFSQSRNAYSTKDEGKSIECDCKQIDSGNHKIS